MSKKINILGLLVFLALAVCKADSWSEYKETEYFSNNKKYKLVVTPTFTPKKYYEWVNFKRTKEIHNKKIDRRRKKFFKTVTAKDTVIIPCHGKLFSMTETDTILIWERKLLNDICPVNAIVSNDGSSIATFNNWFSNGYGENVMVVYTEKGDVKKTYSLSDISPYPLNDYMISISSIWWDSGAKFIDNERIEIGFHTERKDTTTRIYNTRLFEFEKITTP